MFGWLSVRFQYIGVNEPLVVLYLFSVGQLGKLNTMTNFSDTFAQYSNNQIIGDFLDLLNCFLILIAFSLPVSLPVFVLHTFLPMFFFLKWQLAIGQNIANVKKFQMLHKELALTRTKVPCYLGFSSFTETNHKKIC